MIFWTYVSFSGLLVGHLASWPLPANSAAALIPADRLPWKIRSSFSQPCHFCQPISLHCRSRTISKKIVREKSIEKQSDYFRHSIQCQNWTKAFPLELNPGKKVWNFKNCHRGEQNDHCCSFAGMLCLSIWWISTELKKNPSKFMDIQSFFSLLKWYWPF